MDQGHIAELIYVSQLLRRQAMAMLLTLRIEGLSDDLIPGLEIPTGTPLVYELDKDQRANCHWHSPNPTKSRGMRVCFASDWSMMCFLGVLFCYNLFDLGVPSSSLFPYQDHDITFGNFETNEKKTSTIQLQGEIILL